MSDLFSISNFMTLLMLIFLQIVLGFDNLLYISIESKRVAEEKKQFVRRTGISVAIFLRILLLFVLMSAIGYFTRPFFSIGWRGVIEGAFNVHSLIEVVGGAFIIYTALKEITHMLSTEDISLESAGNNRSVGSAIFWIALMNLVFSFDSILSALALTRVFWVMATAIVISGVMMIFLADRVAEFLRANRMYEVLGLFILLIVGVMLLSEGGHLAGLLLFGYAVEPLAKSTFYFAITVLVLCDLIQNRYAKKLQEQHPANPTGG